MSTQVSIGEITLAHHSVPEHLLYSLLEVPPFHCYQGLASYTSSACLRSTFSIPNKAVITFPFLNGITFLTPFLAL